MPGDSAGHDSVEMPEVGFDVDRDAVETDPASPGVCRWRRSCPRERGAVGQGRFLGPADPVADAPVARLATNTLNSAARRSPSFPARSRRHERRGRARPRPHDIDHPCPSARDKYTDSRAGCGRLETSSGSTRSSARAEVPAVYSGFSDARPARHSRSARRGDGLGACRHEGHGGDRSPSAQAVIHSTARHPDSSPAVLRWAWRGDRVSGPWRMVDSRPPDRAPKTGKRSGHRDLERATVPDRCSGGSQEPCVFRCPPDRHRFVPSIGCCGPGHEWFSTEIHQRPPFPRPTGRWPSSPWWRCGSQGCPCGRTRQPMKTANLDLSMPALGIEPPISLTTVRSWRNW